MILKFKKLIPTYIIYNKIYLIRKYTQECKYFVQYNINNEYINTK